MFGITFCIDTSLSLLSYVFSFNGAPISLLERHRMIGEWFVLPKGEDAIHIFSADADRFVKLDKDTIVAAALNLDEDDEDDDKDILIFRPFQTWNMCSAILCKAGSDLGNTFRKCTHSIRRVVTRTHLSHSFSNLSLLLRTQTDTTTCSSRTTRYARSWSGTIP